MSYIEPTTHTTSNVITLAGRPKLRGMVKPATGITAAEFRALTQVLPSLCGSCEPEDALGDDGDRHVTIVATEWSAEPAFRLHREDGALVLTDLRRAPIGDGEIELGTFEAISEVITALRRLMGTRQSA